MKEYKTDWIYYLKLSPKLSKNFFDMDAHFKERGITLIPVTLSELLGLTKGEGDFHCVSCIASFADAKYYLKKARKIIHILLRSKRMHWYIASSFAFTNEASLFSVYGNYHFARLPIGVKKFCDIIVTTIHAKSNSKTKWPGGKRPRMGL